MKQGALLLVYLVEKHRVGYSFVRSRHKWPLHITLVPWFSISPDREALLVNNIELFLKSTTPFEVIDTQNELFGPDGDIPVRVVAAQESLKSIHICLLDLIEQGGGKINDQEVQWIGDNYRAHITIHDNDNREDQTKELIDEVTLLRLVENNYCRVEQKFKIGHAS